MLYYLRLWRRFVVLSWMQLAEYRGNFLLDMGQSVIQVVFAVLPLMLIYRFTEDVAGWSQADVLLLAGIYRIIESVIWLQIGENMQAISHAIRDGELDMVLLRPVKASSS